MTGLRRSASALLLILAAFLAGCAENPTQPQAVDPEPTATEAQSEAVNASLLGLPASLLGGGNGVTVVQRNRALGQDLSVTRTIRPRGGFISLWGAGLTLYFPPGAVSAPTSITVTAPQGDLVGYEMQPHGLTFNVPVIAVQNLWGTNGFGALGLTAAYFDSPLASVVPALEILPLHAPALPWFAVFRIDHFSGYVVAWD